MCLLLSSIVGIDLSRMCARTCGHHLVFSQSRQSSFGELYAHYSRTFQARGRLEWTWVRLSAVVSTFALGYTLRIQGAFLLTVFAVIGVILAFLSSQTSLAIPFWALVRNMLFCTILCTVLETAVYRNARSFWYTYCCMSGTIMLQSLRSQFLLYSDVLYEHLLSLLTWVGFP